MKRYERVMGVLLILIGLAVMYYSYFVLQLGAFNHPGPGFMPFWCGLSVVILSAVWLFGNRKPDENPRPLFGKKGQWVRPLIALAVLIGYAAIMESLGYILSTLIFLLTWQFAVEREKWVRGMVISAVTTAGMYVLFIYLLKVALPTGIFAL